MAKHHREAPIIVVGGGFGGLFTTYHLTAGAGRVSHQPVLLVSRDEEFVFKPLLPEAVGGTTPPQFLTNNLPRLAKTWNFSFLQAQVNGIDLRNRVVDTSEGPRPFREIVVALGSEVNTHGVKVRRAGVFQLHDLEDHKRLRAHVKKQVQRAVRAKTAETRAAALSFVSVGAGPTGIETLAELQEYVGTCLELAQASALVRHAQYTLIEATHEILSQMRPRIRTDVMRVLKRRGITIATGSPVVRVTEAGCQLADGRAIPGSTIVWAAGIRAHPLVRDMGLPTDGLGRVHVDNFLRPRGQVHMFALGDNACAVDAKTGAPLPANGQVAVQQAKTVAANIMRARRRKPLQPFKYMELGQLIPLGRGEAAGHVLGRPVSGAQGWLASRAAYMSRILGLDNRIGLAWGWGRQAMTQSLLRPLWR